jgi:hypothetical protein
MCVKLPVYGRKLLIMGRYIMGRYGRNQSLKTIVTNARFAGMQVTGVQRSAHEIVSRLLSDNWTRYDLLPQN